MPPNSRCRCELPTTFRQPRKDESSESYKIYKAVTICKHDQFISYFTEANIRESVQINLYNPNFSASASKIRKMLANADLQSHGYKKKINKPGSTRQACQCIIAWSECSSFQFIYLSKISHLHYFQEIPN